MPSFTRRMFRRCRRRSGQDIDVHQGSSSSALVRNKGQRRPSPPSSLTPPPLYPRPHLLLKKCMMAKSAEEEKNEGEEDEDEDAGEDVCQPSDDHDDLRQMFKIPVSHLSSDDENHAKKPVIFSPRRFGVKSLEEPQDLTTSSTNSYYFSTEFPPTSPPVQLKAVRKNTLDPLPEQQLIQAKERRRQQKQASKHKHKSKRKRKDPEAKALALQTHHHELVPEPRMSSKDGEIKTVTGLLLQMWEDQIDWQEQADKKFEKKSAPGPEVQTPLTPQNMPSFKNESDRVELEPRRLSKHKSATVVGHQARHHHHPSQKRHRRHQSSQPSLVGKKSACAEVIYEEGPLYEVNGEVSDRSSKKSHRRHTPPPTRPKPVGYVPPPAAASDGMKHINPLAIRKLRGSEELGDLDSLDGQMPSGHRSQIPEPQSTSANFNHENSNPSSIPSYGVGFTEPPTGTSSHHKGPGSKNRKHKKLPREPALYNSDEEGGAIYEERTSNNGGPILSLDLISEKSGSPAKDQNTPPTPPPIPGSSFVTNQPVSVKSAHSHNSKGDQKKPDKKSNSMAAGSSARSASTSAIAMSCNPFSGSLWERREPYSHLWVTLSSMYGKFLVLLMLAFCLIEVMDNNIRPLTFQGIYMMYLYIGSIVAIMCIYITVLLDNCPSLTRSNKTDQIQSSKGKIDPETGSVASFGTLRRAHIDRKKVSRTSFYLRVGALVFGLGTLIFTGLEIAMHATMENSCVEDILIAHPVLQALFTFLQMHFLFVNSQVIVERFGLFARFGFMHLVATNLCLWIRTIIWESANEWIHHIYRDNEQTRLLLTGGGDVFASSTKIRETPLALGLRAGTINYGPYTNNYFTDRSFTNVNDNEYEYVDNSFGQGSAPLGEIQAPPSAAQFGTFCNNSSLPIAKEHLKYVISLYQCFNDNALGKLWTSSMPYLFPFIIEYSLIAAAVTYIMWKNVGNDKIQRVEGKKIKDDEESAKKRRGYWRVDCQSASKGLFLGLLCLVGGIIILIIFFVMKDNAEFSEEMFWIFVGMEIAILGLAILGCLGGFVQMQKLSHSFHKPYDLDNLLSSVTVVGAYIYAIFSMIAAGMDIQNQKHMFVFIQNGLLLIQVTLQGLIMTEAGRRICSTRMQQYVKPGRQLITFLLFANITLWILDTFMTHSWITQGVQLQFYGLLAWGIISRISIPLLVFYRFHSCVVLVEIWKNTYRTKESF